ncbi:MAG: hypothetical protein IKW47_03400 [Alistipes sp.]|nr:hypothetical protein [Alistipes sp.]
MNRLLGTLFAIATIVAIVFAILNFGNYTSMRSAAEPTSADAAPSEQTEIIDETLGEPANSVALGETASEAPVTTIAE